MSKSHKNPYTGQYYKPLFEYMQKAKVYTRADLIAQAVKLGMSDKVRKGAKAGLSPAECTVTVMLSPRDVKQEGLRGDPRGNLSARGEVYFNELLKRETGEKQRFRLRWRETELERRSRSAKEVKQEKKRKTSKTTKKVAKPAKRKTTKKVAEAAPVAPEAAPVAPETASVAPETASVAPEATAAV